MQRDLGDGHLMPVGLRAAAGWTWRMAVVGVGIYYLLRLLEIFEVLVVPVLVAVLLVALLRPITDQLSAQPARPGRRPGSSSGIVGGLFAVPLAAVVNVVAKYLSDDSPEPDGDEGPPADEPGPTDDAERHEEEGASAGS